MCMRTGCSSQATSALRFNIQIDGVFGSMGYLSAYACDDHSGADEMEALVDVSWPHFQTFFEMRNVHPPDRNQVEWEWVPIEEAEDFWNANQHKATKPRVN